MSPKLLVSDMDFTLLNDHHVIDPRNLAAIAKHVERGGLFTVATGRPAAVLRKFQELAPYINLPAIGSNGSQLFDFHTGEILWECHLPNQVCALMAETADRFPLMGIASYYADAIAIHRDNEYTRILLEKEGRTADYTDFAHATLPWQKVLMAGERDYLEEINTALTPRVADYGRLVFSEAHFLEILCKGVSKGQALATLLERVGLPASEVVAVGDAPNDLEMLQLAGIGVAVANAEPQVKAAADALVGHHNDAAIAQCVEQFF